MPSPTLSPAVPASSESLSSRLRLTCLVIATVVPASDMICTSSTERGDDRVAPEFVRRELTGGDEQEPERGARAPASARRPTPPSRVP